LHPFTWIPSCAGGIGRWREVGDFSDLGSVVEGVFIFCSYHIHKGSATTPNRALSRNTRTIPKEKGHERDAVAFLAGFHVLQKCINTLTEWMGAKAGLFRKSLISRLITAVLSASSCRALDAMDRRSRLKPFVSPACF
jgi:hypothetical protein